MEVTYNQGISKQSAALLSQPHSPSQAWDLPLKVTPNIFVSEHPQAPFPPLEDQWIPWSVASRGLGSVKIQLHSIS